MRREQRWIVGGVVWVAIALALCLVGGQRHDYRAYVVQWAHVLAGDDPWADLGKVGRNAYGPLHNVFALLLPAGGLAPKVAAALLFVVALALLTRRLFRGLEPPEKTKIIAYCALLPLNLLTLFMGFWNGSNDLVAAALLIFAINLKLEHRHAWAGAMIGLAVLDKFYPAVFLPFFLIGDRRLSAAWSCIGVCAAGMSAAYLVWGSSILEPLSFASDRNAGLLSPINGLRQLNLRPLSGIVQFLTQTNSIMVVCIWIAVGLFTWRRGNHWLSCLAITTLAVLLTYKVGHQQFYLSWLASVGALLVIRTEETDLVAVAALPFACFLSAYELIFDFVRALTILGRPIFAFIATAFALISLVQMIRVRPTNSGHSRGARGIRLMGPG